MEVEYNGDADTPCWYAKCPVHSQEFIIERWDGRNHRRLAIESQKKAKAQPA